MIPRVDGYDPGTTPFSVFVMRPGKNSTLGWEYCGEYILLSEMRGTTGAHCVPQSTKNFILHDIKSSLSRPNGLWHDFMKRYKEEILGECELDPSPAGPTRLIRFAGKEPEPDDEGKEREDRIDRESHERASDAAKARALGLDNEDLSHIEFAELLVHYDDFYGSLAIQFVSYDEEMYKYVKEGRTTKNKHNKKRAEGEPCAKASDWYNIMDQKLDENHRQSKRKRKLQQEP